jgi:hypothetical protein
MSDVIITQHCPEEFDTKLYTSTVSPTNIPQEWGYNRVEQYAPGYESRLLNVNLGCEAVNVNIEYRHFSTRIVWWVFP